MEKGYTVCSFRGTIEGIAELEYACSQEVRKEVKKLFKGKKRCKLNWIGLILVGLGVEERRVLTYKKINGFLVDIDRISPTELKIKVKESTICSRLFYDKVRSLLDLDFYLESTAGGVIEYDTVMGDAPAWRVYLSHDLLYEEYADGFYCDIFRNYARDKLEQYHRTLYHFESMYTSHTLEEAWKHLQVPKSFIELLEKQNKGRYDPIVRFVKLTSYKSL